MLGDPIWRAKGVERFNALVLEIKDHEALWNKLVTLRVLICVQSLILPFVKDFVCSLNTCYVIILCKRLDNL